MNFEKRQNRKFNTPTHIIENIDQTKISQLKESPHFVTREIRFEELESRYRGKLKREYRAIELAELGKKLFEELREYGIDSPVRFFIGKDDNQQVLFSVVGRIERVVSTQEEKMNQEFHRLYESLSQYYLDKLRDGEAYLTDINNSEQYVYGKKSSGEEEETKMYLVDTDIYLDDRKEALLTVVYWLVRHSLRIGRDSKVIENIKAFVNEYKEKFTHVKEKDKERLSQLEQFLSGGGFGEEILPAIPIFEEE